MKPDHQSFPGARVARVAVALLFALRLAAGDSPYPELPNFNQVNRVLFRGAQPKAGGLKRLASLGIKTVLDLKGTLTRDGDAARDAQEAGLRYYNIALSSYRRPAMSDVASALAIINDPANQPVFVHCSRGGDRTGVVVAAYRITHDGWSGEAALREAQLHAFGFWQSSMKQFILEYPRGRHPASAASPEPSPAPAPAPVQAPAPTAAPAHRHASMHAHASAPAPEPAPAPEAVPEPAPALNP